MASRPRKPVTAVKAGNRGPVALYAVVGLIAAAIVGFGAWSVYKPGSAGHSWETRAGQIPGITNFRATTDLSRDHAWGPLTYPQNPPVGGKHAPPPLWQQCMGNIYEHPIPNEHAVHSLEHGAAWLAYRSDLPQDQKDALAAKMRGKTYTMMSPVDGLDHAVSLQAWGYQLKVDDVNDSRIDEFLSALAKNASIEPGATCSGGTTAVGDTPLTEEQAAQLGG